MEYDPKKPLISIHIPKCAGSSFSEILKKWFGRKLRKHYPNGKLGLKPIKHNLYSGVFKKEPIKGLCIHGHFNHQRGNGVKDYYPDADQFITIIRDPFNLHLSTYFYIKRQRKKGSGFREGKIHPVLLNEWSLEEYLHGITKSYICDFLPPEINLQNYKEILDRFLFIGITEELQKSIDKLAEKLGFHSVSMVERNKSDWDEQIPEGARQIFTENNRLEMAIYDYVCNKLML